MSAVEPDDNVKPEDSVSQCGSTVKSAASSTSSSSSRLRAKAMARRAALAAEAEGLRLQQELENQQLQLKQRRCQLDLQTRLEIAKAEEIVFSELYKEENASRASRQRSKSVTSVHQDQARSKDQAQQARSPDQEQDVTIPYPIRTEPFPSYPAGNEDRKIFHFQQLSQVQEQNHRLLEAISLSNAEVIRFNGDPLHYFEFIRSFDNLIGGSSLDNGAKLLKLFHCCEGDSKSIVQCCMVMDPVLGYGKARMLLEERFGSKFKISEAWVRKVTSGPSLRVNDKKGLQRFADELRICNETLHALNMTNEMSSQQHLVKIVERLPYHLRSSWLKCVKKIRHQGRSPNVSDVVNFVADAAEEVNDPVFGGLLEDRKKEPQRSKGSMSHGSRSFPSFGVNFTRSDNKDVKKCFLCSKDHGLFACQQFKDMKPEERFKLAQEKRLCYNCLKPGHVSSKCFLNRTCSVKGCNRRHTKFLHFVKKAKGDIHGGDAVQKEPEMDDATDVQNSYAGSGNITGAGNLKIALPIVPVEIRAVDGSTVINTFALLDTGSTSSFCTEELAEKLGAKGRRKVLSISTLEKAHSYVECKAVSLIIKNPSTHYEIELPCVYTKQDINVSSKNTATKTDVQSWDHLKDLDFPTTNLHDIDLLIGQDTPEALQPLEVRFGPPKGVYAVRTMLGWTLNGPLGSSRQDDNDHITSSFISSDDGLETQLKMFWSLESTESLRDQTKGLSVNDKKALAVWNDTVQLKEGHYELSIPFKENPSALPNNYQVASDRLDSLGRRLRRDEQLHEKYTKELQSLLEEGYAEEVNEKDVHTDNPTWYLPHHPVLNPKKPDKTRIVFDCAAKCQGKSLNDAVMQGPDMTNKLLGVLLRFRQEPTAMMADIQAMFHQVRVPPEERDMLRFLWWPDGDLSQRPKVFRMCVHLFGGTWSPSCCSFALKRTAEDHKEEYSPEAVKAVAHNFYVDDCLISCEIEEKAITIVSELRSLLDKGGFKLTKWTSNNAKVLASIPEEDRAKQVKGLDLNRDALPTERALGVVWNTELDCISYKITHKNKPLTRRGLLSEMASVYDPYGFAGPFILYAKGLLQELTALKLGWDDPIPDECRDRWQRWKAELPFMEDVMVSRCYRPYDFGQVMEYQLHHFCDASERAYGVVTYLRMKNCQGQVYCNIVMAKSRLAPLKKITVPRLELMATTLAVTMDGMIKRELDLKLSESVFWTDSTIVLHYIGNEDKRYHTFVANRVAAIRDGSEPRQWRHVSSELNPADDITRGLTPGELHERWLRGPEFLYTGEDQWPRCLVLQEDGLDDDPEVKHSHRGPGVFTSAHSELDEGIERLLGKYSSWFGLKKAVAYILRLRKYLRRKAGHGVKFEGSHMNQPLSMMEINEAEEAVVRYVQKKHFEAEYECLEEMTKDTEENDKAKMSRKIKVMKSSPLSRLDPVMTEKGLICVGGRLQYSTVATGYKHPVILPKKHHVVEVLVRHTHEVSGHSGQEHVLASMRERYWIIGGRSTVKEVLRKCFICKRQSAKPMVQKMSDLPRERVTPDKPPFTYVGVDCFGPFTIKQGRKVIKRYGCIFTCLVLRAIHIEVLHSMDTSSFINGLERFISRRGRPEVIWSDNGSNFIGAERELREGIKCWNQHQIHQFLLQREITWKFNPPTASHMGGVWERQIRTVRKILSALLRQQSLFDEGLTTLMCKVESIINGRPLTVVSTDMRDPEPLTPNHLLLMRPNAELPPGVFDESDLYSRKRWRQVQYMADVFWKRWTKEYLPTLQQRQKWHDESRNIAVDDIVLVVDDMLRNKWLLGRVVEIYPGKDKLVRSAKVKTVTGALTRPIHKLCLLETVEK